MPSVTPVALSPAPLVVTPEIVTSEFPVFVSEAFKDALPPTFTLPKERLAGFAVSRGAVAEMPVPPREMDSGDPTALLTSEMAPVALPEAVGANETLKVAVPLGVTVSGAVSPVIANPAPETLACEIVVFDVPAFVSVIVSELLPPIVTFPKLTAVGEAASCGCG